jgi:HlyD family secretion protein
MVVKAMAPPSRQSCPPRTISDGDVVDKPVEPKEPLDIRAILSADAASAPGWMRKPILRWGAAAVALSLLAAMLWWLAGSGAAIRYVTEPVRRGNLVVIVTATGSIQPTNQVDVSSELSGTVRGVLVDYNSVVTVGQPLAELDTDKLKATVDSSRAKLAAARAKVTEAEATVVEKERILERKKALALKQVTSIHDLDEAQAAYDRAVASLASTRADVGVAEADLRLNETNLGKACICSPINGIVLKRNVEPGQTVASSLQAPILFSIAEDLKQMELQVDVDEADVGKVRAGQSASFSVDAFPDRKFPAAIRDVRYASETIQGVVTYKAVLMIDNSELLLRPGMTATAEIRVIEISDALLVANTALRFTPPVAESTGGQSLLRRILPGPPRFRPASQREEAGPNRSVWVLRNGEPTEVKVVIGPSDGKRTEVRSGQLQVGQALIVEQTTTKQ